MHFSSSSARGFSDFAARSFPSIHAAVAWATATTLVGEVKFRNPDAVKYVAPPLFAAATRSGLHADVSQPTLGQRRGRRDVHGRDARLEGRLLRAHAPA